MSLRDLVETLLPRDYILDNVARMTSRRCDLNDSSYGIVIRCNNYKVKVDVAKVGSDYWFDIVAYVADCNEPSCIEEALRIAGNISLCIEEKMIDILMSRNTRYFRRLREFLSNVSITLNAFPFIGVQVTGPQEEQQGTRRIENTGKEQPGVLTVRVGPFTKITVNFRKGIRQN